MFVAAGADLTAADRVRRRDTIADREGAHALERSQRLALGRRERGEGENCAARAVPTSARTVRCWQGPDAVAKKGAMT